MKKIASLALSAVLTTTSLGAFAQGPGGPDERRDSPRQSQGQSHGQGQGKSGKQQDRGPGGDQGRQERGPQSRAPEGRQEARQDQRHEQRSDFRKGQALDRQYRQHRYVVEDWRGHKLSRPPRGHHWVQVGDRYVLVAVATGVIASIILSH
jgi:nickel/cobalt homeostasis protein